MTQAQIQSFIWKERADIALGLVLSLIAAELMVDPIFSWYTWWMTR